jgi:hypothetical protein
MHQFTSPAMLREVLGKGARYPSLVWGYGST